MKRILLLFILLITTAQTIQSQTVVLDTNVVTVKWTGTTVPSPYFVQANPRGTGMEWFAIVDNSTKNNINDYARNTPSGITFFTPPTGTAPIPFNNIVTTLVTNMNQLFYLASSFNQPISSWDVSNVINMSSMFREVTTFNQPIGSWNVSNVNNVESLFLFATSFNQPIGSWNVSNVTNMNRMFQGANNFNQPIGSWNVSNVTNMSYMFGGASNFNQPIGTWNVSNVTNMSIMFSGSAFNQPIGSWNVSNVTNMESMFNNATAFNQPIGSWNVSRVTNMANMFYRASSINQPLGSWNVGNVTRMDSMFRDATIFNQPLGSWNVSNATTMSSMFEGLRLSTANYDEILIGWSTISPNETPLKPNVVFSGGNSKYCNSASARASIISTYGWTITDGGLDCSSLDTETFETNSFKLYPNPAVSVLNIKTDNNFINQPYSIIDGLGRIVLNGKLNEVESTINVEQLSKGIYYLKIAGNSANKFIKE